MNHRLFIILVNFNQKKDIIDCLRSITQSTRYPIKIIISDNGSTDGSIEFIRKRYPDIEIIYNHTNLGYAEANNRVLSFPNTKNDDFFLLLNSDTVLPPHFLDTLMFEIKHPRFDIIGTKIFYYEKPHIIWFAGGYFDPIQCTHYQRGQGEKDSEQYDNVEPCDFITGCALVIKKSLFEKLGGYNPYFFMYCEDLDLCLRAKKIGATVGYIPFSKVYHKIKDYSIKETSPLARYYYIRNILYTVKEYFSHGAKQNSYTRPFLYCLFRVIRSVTIRPAITLAGLLGLIDFLLKNRGQCNQYYSRILGYLARK